MIKFKMFAVILALLVCPLAYAGQETEGASSSANMDLTINPKPVADPGSPRVNRMPVAKPSILGSRVRSVGDTIVFNGDQSYDPDGDPLIYGWDFGDGTTDSGVSVTHAYNQALNPAVVTLTVTDTKGASATLTLTINANNKPVAVPVVREPRDPMANDKVVFDSSGSFDPDGNTIMAYLWNFGDPDSDFNANSNMHPSHTYRNAGTYLVTLMVTDSKGLRSDVETLPVVVGGRPDYRPEPVSSVIDTRVQRPIENETIYRGNQGAEQYMGQHKKHEFNVGTEISHISYKERSVDVKEKGVFTGVYANYTFRPQGGWINFYRLDGHLNFGRMDYSGTGEIKDINNYLVEPRILLGKSMHVNEAGSVTPYIGLGYRRLHDGLGGQTSSTGFAGYDRLSQLYYVPVGVYYEATMNDRWDYGANAEYDIFIHGTHHSYLSDVPGFSDVNNAQTKGFGLRGSLDLKYKAGRVAYLLSPYIRYWNIGKSNTVHTSYLGIVDFPKSIAANTSTELGVKLGVQF